MTSFITKITDNVYLGNDDAAVEGFDSFERMACISTSVPMPTNNVLLRIPIADEEDIDDYYDLFEVFLDTDDDVLVYSGDGGIAALMLARYLEEVHDADDGWEMITDMVDWI